MIQGFVMRRAGLALALAVASWSAQAADLLEIWQAARAHDPGLRSLQALRAAGESQRTQSRALWRPTLGVTALAGAGSAKSFMEGAEFSTPVSSATPGMSASNASFSTQTDLGVASNLHLTARWPLYGPERQAQSRQLSLSADAAQLQWQLSEQQWTLELVQRYFTTVLASRRVDLLNQQLEAARRVAREAQDRFRLGDKPVTDTHEAQAHALSLEAMAVQAENALAIARAHLADLTAIPVTRLQSLALPASPERLTPVRPLLQWQDEASLGNPQLKLQQLKAGMAMQEVSKQRHGSGASVDLVAQAGSERLSGDAGDSSTYQRRAVVGLSVNLPLYTGGWRSAKLEEALKLEEAARLDLERLQLDVHRNTRAQWLDVQAAQAREVALTQALQASRARLEATQLGQQVGDRTTLELLQAQSDAAAAELSLLQARIDLLQGRLGLAAQAGQLNEHSLREVNAALAP